MTPVDPRSTNVANLRESATIAVAGRARALKAAGRSIIDLGSGEPDFDTPQFIREAAVEAIANGATRYTATEGILPLREAIADEMNARVAGQQLITPGDIVVSTGSKQSLFNACFTVFGPGDEVLIPTPGWTSYYEIVGLARATPVPVFGTVENGFKVTAAELESAASERTRGVIINSPSNPTGSVYTREELGEILALAEERGWWVISDEIYRHLTYGLGGSAASVLEVASSRDRLIVVDGVAKAYAMTGWRIGWTAAPHAVTVTMKALQSHITSNPAAPSQYAALAALIRKEEAAAAIERMRSAFEQRRNAALALFRELPEVSVIQPDGAFYLYIHAGNAVDPEEDDPGLAFSRRLLDDSGVAVVPGSAFGTPDWIRMSYATRLEDAVEGARRICSLLEVARQAARVA